MLLASALQSNSRLTELDLTNNQIGPAAGAKVLAAVADGGGMRRTLRTLKMGGNRLGDHKGVRDALCNLVRSQPRGSTPTKGVVASHPPALRTLHLEGNKLGARTAAPLSAALAESALTDLDLSWNLLQSAGVEVLALALQTRPSSLQTLKLAWNGAGPKGGLALGAMLSGNSELTSLDLQHNNLDGVAAAVIAQALPCLYTCHGSTRYGSTRYGCTYYGYTHWLCSLRLCTYYGSTHYSPRPCLLWPCLLRPCLLWPCLLRPCLLTRRCSTTTARCAPSSSRTTLWDARARA